MGALAAPRVLWALIPHGRGGRLVATVLVGTVLAGAASLIPGSTPVSPSGVDIWVATNGSNSTCVRGNQAFPCLTVQKALTLAQNGDQIEVAAGTYATAETWAAATTGVTVAAASGATVNFSNLVDVTASNLTVDGIHFTYTPASTAVCIQPTTNPDGASLHVSGANFTLNNATVAAHLGFSETADGFLVENSTVHAFVIVDDDGTGVGTDNWTIDNVVQDVGGVVYCSPVGTQTGSVIYYASNWTIQNSTFKNCTNSSDSSQHSECLYIGAGNHNGTISGNTFGISQTSRDSGSTAMIFFTWWPQGSSGSLDPTNICVTGNTFYPAINPFWFIDMRSELNWATNNIDIDPNTNTFVYDNGGSYPSTIASVMTAVRVC